jgi:hypothetical protein
VTDTLALAKRELWDAMQGDGMACPCCKRFAKLYPYTISSAQAAAFKWIVDHTGRGKYIDVQANAPRWLLQSNSHGKLVHWSLLHTQKTKDPRTKTSGMWGPTEFGMDWFAGHTSVHKYALVFADKCHGLRGDPVKFGDVFDRYAYNILMATTVESTT